MRFGCGNAAKIPRRTSRSQGVRAKLRSICERVSSISWS